MVMIRPMRKFETICIDQRNADLECRISLLYYPLLDILIRTGRLPGPVTFNLYHPVELGVGTAQAVLIGQQLDLGQRARLLLLKVV